VHELSLCQSIYGIAARAAGGRRVTLISLDVGQLRQVVPDTLVRCWELVCEATPLAGSTLAVNHIPAQAVCQDCGVGMSLGGVLKFVCAGCGGQALRVVAGEEFMVRSIDVAGGGL
jgi:hydrogenase nickel incorporation protein HypA/HybF